MNSEKIMNEKLDFSLPDKKRKNSFVSGTVIILLLILMALGATNLLTNSGNPGVTP